MSPNVDTEDDDYSSYGPLPDPSQRSWRHPSEIAAENAGAVQPDPDGHPSSDPAQIIRYRLAEGQPSASTNSTNPGQFWTFTIGAAAILGLCLGGFALASMNTRNRLNTLESEPDLVMAGVGPASDSRLLDGDHRTSPANDPDAPPASDSGSQSVSTTQPRLTNGLDDSEVAQAVEAEANPLWRWQGNNPITPTPTSAVLTSTADGSVSNPAAYPSSLAATGSSAAGVLPLFLAPNQMPIANGIVVDGLILTSASSLGDFEQFYSPAGSQWISLSLLASDPHTDIAVLQASQTGSPLTPVVTSPEGPSADAGQRVAVLAAHNADPSAAIELSEVGADFPAIGNHAPTGEVVATEERSTTSDGYEVLGTLLTTCRNGDLFGGAALIDEQGHVVGIVVDSDGKLAAALPLDSAIEIGWSLVLEGWRGGGWLGIEGRTVEEGVQLIEVDPNGPAALAGLLDSDLLTNINGHRLNSFAELLHILRLLDSGDTIRVDVLRPNGETSTLSPTTIEIELADKPGP